MSISFNLIDQPWIPCLRADGTRREFGLSEALKQAHQLREIQGDTPLETAALHRLLLALLHRVFDGPKNRAAWVDLWAQGQFEDQALQKYMLRTDVYPRFDLFHPKRPFYQSLDPRVKAKSVITMVLHMASGNNATLFDHNTEEDGAALTPAQAARALITSQAFGVCGLSGLTEKFKDAPCAKGIIFFAAGESAFETLMLNLVRYYEDTPLPQPNADDCPAWEMDDPFMPDRNHPRGYLDYLTWHNRRIWLYPEMSEHGVSVRQMSWAPGLCLHAEDIDPMKQYIASEKKGFRALCFQPDRAIWRDSAVLLQFGGQNKPPRMVRWMADLAERPPKALEASRQYRLMALGLAKDRARFDFMRAESLPLPTDFLTKKDCVGNLSAALKSAEDTSTLLNRCTFLLAWLIIRPSTPDKSFEEQDKGFDGRTRIDKKIAAGKNEKSKDREAQQVYQLFSSFGVGRMYWSQLETHFNRFIQDLPGDPEAAKDDWRKYLRRAARGAFNQAAAYAGTDRRAQRAVIKAEEQFKYGLARLLNVQDLDPINGGESDVEG